MELIHLILPGVIQGLVKILSILSPANFSFYVLIDDRVGLMHGGWYFNTPESCDRFAER